MTYEESAIDSELEDGKTLGAQREWQLQVSNVAARPHNLSRVSKGKAGEGNVVCGKVEEEECNLQVSLVHFTNKNSLWRIRLL